MLEKYKEGELENVRNRLYFLQDLKNVLEKHNANFEIETFQTSVKFTYDLNNDGRNSQVRNLLADYSGEIWDDDIQRLIENEEKELIYLGN